MDDFDARQDGKLGLSINTLMREVLIEEGIPYARACQLVDSFGRVFDALTGTEWLEVNGTTEWHLRFDARPRTPITEDTRKKQGIPAECPCGKPHPKTGKRDRREDQ